jgi:hypothetical protein
LQKQIQVTKKSRLGSGIRIERSERGAPGEFDWVEKLSIAELQALAEGKLDIASFKDESGSGRSRLN